MNEVQTYDTDRFYPGSREKRGSGRYVARHYPEGSIIYPEASDESIFLVSNGTPCVSREMAALIVDALNERNR